MMAAQAASSGLPPTMADVMNATFFGPTDLPLMLLLWVLMWVARRAKQFIALAYVAITFISYGKGN